MPRPYRTTLTISSDGAAASTPWMPSYGQDPFSIGIGISRSSSGAGPFTVQHTFDPIFFPVFGSSVGTSGIVASTGATWYNHSVITALSCNIDGNYSVPVMAIRIISTSVSTAAPTVTMTLVQAGP